MNEIAQTQLEKVTHGVAMAIVVSRHPLPKQTAAIKKGYREPAKQACEHRGSQLVKHDRLTPCSIQVTQGEYDDVLTLFACVICAIQSVMLSMGACFAGLHFARLALGR
ncbi:MAG: hypothetical protein ACR2HJ_09405 [Fimbriimonadales bacterium]